MGVVNKIFLLFLLGIVVVIALANYGIHLAQLIASICLFVAAIADIIIDAIKDRP